MVRISNNSRGLSEEPLEPLGWATSSVCSRACPSPVQLENYCTITCLPPFLSLSSQSCPNTQILHKHNQGVSQLIRFKELCFPESSLLLCALTHMHLSTKSKPLSANSWMWWNDENNFYVSKATEYRNPSDTCLAFLKIIFLHTAKGLKQWVYFSLL